MHADTRTYIIICYLIILNSTLKRLGYTSKILTASFSCVATNNVNTSMYIDEIIVLLNEKSLFGKVPQICVPVLLDDPHHKSWWTLARSHLIRMVFLFPLHVMKHKFVI